MYPERAAATAAWSACTQYSTPYEVPAFEAICFRVTFFVFGVLTLVVVQYSVCHDRLMDIN